MYLAEAIQHGLRLEAIAADLAHDGDAALELLAITSYDAVVLDRDLPGVHGDEVCRRIVADGSGSRVLMLTAASTVRQRVAGLGLGADDYLPKPFDFAELVARIRALGRRPSTALPPILRSGDLVLDPNLRVVIPTRAGRFKEISDQSIAFFTKSGIAKDRILHAGLPRGGSQVGESTVATRVWVSVSTRASRRSTSSMPVGPSNQRASRTSTMTRARASSSRTNRPARPITVKSRYHHGPCAEAFHGRCMPSSGRA